MFNLPPGFHEAAQSITSLDVLQTKACEGDVPPSLPSFRHSGWEKHRERVIAAMGTIPHLAQRTARFKSCGADSWVVQDKDDSSHVMLVGSYCGDRFCKPCALARSHVLAENVHSKAPPGPYRLVTLTLPSSHVLSEVLTHLFDSWKRFRLSPLFKDRVTGGVCFLEITHSLEKGWHPHFHLVCVGNYWRYADLNALWSRCARVPVTVVDIRRARDLPAVLCYLTRYASKLVPPSISSSLNLLTTAIAALASRRSISTFGTWRGLRLLSPLPSEYEWRLCGTLSWVHAEARQGNPQAGRLLMYLNHPEIIHAQWTDVFPNKSPPPLQNVLFPTNPIM